MEICWGALPSELDEQMSTQDVDTEVDSTGGTNLKPSFEAYAGETIWQTASFSLQAASHIVLLLKSNQLAPLRPSRLRAVRF